MQVLEIRHLQSNLSEIYGALYDRQEGKPLPLDVTSSGGIFYSGCLTGPVIKIGDQIWRWVRPVRCKSLEEALTYNLTTLFNQAVLQAYDARLHRIWHNMRQLDQIWKEALEPNKQAEQRVRYAGHLAKALRGSPEAHKPIYLQNFDRRQQMPLNADEERYFRHVIVDFQNAVYPFWRLFWER